MNEKQRKIFQQHYETFQTVADARKHIQDHGTLPLSVWVLHQPPTMPIKEAFERACLEQDEALR